MSFCIADFNDIWSKKTAENSISCQFEFDYHVEISQPQYLMVKLLFHQGFIFK